MGATFPFRNERFLAVFEFFTFKVITIILVHFIFLFFVLLVHTNTTTGLAGIHQILRFLITFGYLVFGTNHLATLPRPHVTALGATAAAGLYQFFVFTITSQVFVTFHILTLLFLVLFLVFLLGALELALGLAVWIMLGGL